MSPRGVEPSRQICHGSNRELDLEINQPAKCPSCGWTDPSPKRYRTASQPKAAITSHLPTAGGQPEPRHHNPRPPR